MSGDYVHYIQIPHLEILCWRSSEIGLLLIFLAGHTTVLVRGPCFRELLMGCCFWSFSCQGYSVGSVAPSISLSIPLACRL